MKTTKKRLPLIVILLTLGAVSLAIWHRAQDAGDQSGQRKILYYQDSMHPWIKSDQPGKCTICVMDLTPIYEGEEGLGGSEDVVVLSSNSVTVMNVQTEVATRRPLYRSLRVAGVLEADSTRKTILAAPAPGRIDNVTVESAGVDVQKGEVLATFYSPDLTFQTRRYIFRDRITETATQPLMTAAFATSSRHIPMSARGSKNEPLVSQEGINADPFFNDLLSTHTGTVIERNVFDGQYVAEGDRLFTIVDCSVLWYRFDVYEQQLAWLEPGQEILITVPTFPGKTFPATIELIEPTVNEITRTAKVRANVPNPPVGEPGRERRLLRLGMYADGYLRAEVADALTVPRSAILFPGGQAYAYVEESRGAFQMRQVNLGRQGDGHWEILSGLEPGERVVISGNVLIDAQAQFNRSSAPSAIASAETGPEDSMESPDHAAAPELTEIQHRAISGFLAVADGISSALAADNLEQLETQTEQLPAVAAALARAFPDDHPWHAAVQAVKASSVWPTSADLAAARKAFLPFSTNTVALVQQLQREEPFASNKVFFCPMAPKPGLWFQAQGPLRNPYYGAMMLHCGEEVAVPDVVHQTTPARVRATAPAKPEVQQHATVTPLALAAVESAPASESAPQGEHAEEPTDPPTEPAQVVMANHTQPKIVSLVPSHPAVSAAAPSSLEPRLGHPYVLAAAGTSQVQPATRRGISHYDRAASSFKVRLTNTPAAATQTRAELQATTTEPAQSDRDGQQKAIRGFLKLSSAMSQALAADDLEAYQKPLGELPGVLTALEKHYPEQQHLKALIRRLTALTQGSSPKRLEEARQRFVALSNLSVEVAKQLRKQAHTAAEFKIYQCPMAPKPGLWLQAEGPLRNPFFGAAMLTCGEEVTP